MTCFFCNRKVSKAQLNFHHVIPKSEGGTITAAAHKSCHIAHHRTQGHFRHWGAVGGRLAAVTRRWAFTLKGVRDDPAYELDRQFYRMFYASA